MASSELRLFLEEDCSWSHLNLALQNHKLNVYQKILKNRITAATTEIDNQRFVT